MGANKHMMARPDTVKRAIEAERNKKFKRADLDGNVGVKYLEQEQQRCISKLTELQSPA